MAVKKYISCLVNTAFQNTFQSSYMGKSVNDKKIHPIVFNSHDKLKTLNNLYGCSQ